MNPGVPGGRQIPLQFEPAQQLDFVDYQCPGDREAVVRLQQLARGDNQSNIYLWGVEGTGKSHLLQAVCTAATRHGRFPVYIPLKQAEEFSPEMLDDLEQLDLVCLDDIERIAGSVEWERGIFNLFNRLRDSGTPLLVASLHNPRTSPLALQDLKSRLLWDDVIRLDLLDETGTKTALQNRARLRGFDLPPEVCDYLLRRVPRDTHTLFALLDTIGEASLVEKRLITVPFIRSLL